jgi:Predicted membrane protein
MLDSLSSFFTSLVAAFSLIGLAEIGDKSQLVCMALAVRYRALPVLLGAVAAFAFLNLVAVVFGSWVARWLSPDLVTLVMGVLFLLFGLHALRSEPEEMPEGEEVPGGHGVLLSTLLLIVVAEFGDKTQVAVAGLAGTLDARAVWLGATLALAGVSALGVWAGRTLLQRLSIRLLHRISGVLFLAIGAGALFTLLS